MKTTSEENLGHEMMLAWARLKRFQSKTWGEWMIIGEGLMAGRRWAMRQAKVNDPQGKGYNLAFHEWLNRYKVKDMDKSDRAKLLQLMEERPAVEEWRASLSDGERRTLNNPMIVWRKWRALNAPIKRSPGGVRLRQANEQLQARIKELQEELEIAQTQIRELEEATSRPDKRF